MVALCKKEVSIVNYPFSADLHQKILDDADNFVGIAALLNSDGVNEQND